MKRYSKLFAFALVAFFASIVPTFAKTLTMDELTKELDENTNSFYMIGTYVFTDAHLLNTTDIMLASRSIILSQAAKEGVQTDKGPIYKEMVIYVVEREGDEWSEPRKVVGEKDLEDTFVVTYIDYEPLPVDTEADFEAGLGTHTNAFQDLDWEGNDKTLELTDNGDGTITVKGLVKYTPEVKYSSVEEENTGYYFSYLLKAKGATDKTTVVATLQNGETKDVSTAWDTKDGETWDMALLAAVNPDADSKELKVTVDLDGEGDAYEPTTYTLDYSEVTFQEPTKVAVTTELSVEAQGELQEAYGYEPNGTVTVDSATKHADDNLPVYKYSGKVFKQTLKNSGYTTPNAGYITFSIKPEKVIPETTTVTVDSASNDGEGAKTITMTDDELVLIRQVKEDPTEIKITVDIDGEGDEYLPYSFYINYSGVEVDEPISTPKELDKLTSEKLQQNFHYTPKAGTEVAFAQEGNTITATGTVMQDKTVTGFGDETTGYYLAFSLVFDKKYDDIQIQIPGRDSKVGIEAFDSDTEIGIIMQINPSARAAGKSFEIKVDKDGEGQDYEEETITVDYSGVNFVSVNVEKLPESSKEGFKNWMGNSYEYTDTFEFSSEKDGVITVTGKAMKHENIEKYSKYQTNYYLVYFLRFDQKYEDIKIDIVNREKPITIDDFDGGKSGEGKLLTLVKPIKQDDTDKQIKLTIDLDGEGETYEPYNLTIDWSQVTFDGVGE